ncbi:VOC family protein [Solirubrobacter soli]|uniref:VOC family protein n=1 Tax=Solirubrobacter soli TaxID=363832 RepID=UPI0004291218|nr:VOC family protein [Solirubrobacter soli]
MTLDHFVIAVSDWEASNAFYRDVVRAEVVERGAGFAYRFGKQQLNVHGPGLDPQPVARDRVRPGNSDMCFVWDGPIDDAVAHLRANDVEIELGPVVRHGAQGEGQSVYFRDPDGSLLEFITY